MISLLKRSKGYTLLEVLIALVISSVGLLGLAQLQIVATRSNSFSNHMTVGINLGKDQLEVLRNLAYDDDQLDVKDHTDGTTVEGGIGFNRRWTVTEDAANSLKTITVNVGWPAGNESYRVMFTTVKTQ